MHVSEMVRHTDGNPICAKCKKIIVDGPVNLTENM